MSALDKLLAASYQPPAVSDPADPYDGQVLVMAADSGLDEACRVLSACDLSSCPPEVRQAAALVYASSVVVDGIARELNLPAPDDALGLSRWVEETALDTLGVRLADSDGKKPYGDVEYADPGYQSDGKKRYPVDTPEHARAAWSYINKGSNASAYSSGDLSKIKNKIRAALKKHGVETSDESNKVAASMAVLELAAGACSMETMIKNHKAMHGAHTHVHLHLNDNKHGPGVFGMAAGSGNSDLIAYHHQPVTGVHSHAHIHANDANHGPMREMRGENDASW